MSKDNSWRLKPLAELGIKPRILEALHDAGLETVGSVQSFLAKPDRTLQDVPGIGEAAEEHVSDKLAAYFDSMPKGEEPAELSQVADPPDVRIERILDANAAVDAARKRLDAAEVAAKDARDVAKAAQAEWESEVRRLQDVIKGRPVQMTFGDA